MSRDKLSFVCSFLLLLLFNISNCASNDLFTLCAPSSCGNIHNIASPFRLTSDPPGCGSLDYELYCEGNSTLLHMNGGKFIVKAINYDNYTIRVVDPGVDAENCSSLPRFPLSYYNMLTKLDYFQPFIEVDAVKVIRCLKPVNSTTYLDANSCFQKLNDGFYRYAYVGQLVDGSDLREGCNVEAMTLLQLPGHPNSSFTEIHRQMAFGFELFWTRFYCSDICHSLKYCYVNYTGNVECIAYKAQTFNEVIVGWLEESLETSIELWLIITAGFSGSVSKVRRMHNLITTDIGYFGPTMFWLSHASTLIFLYVVGRSLCGSPFVMAFIIYKWRKRHQSGYHNIEEFLKVENNAIMPIRYAYSDIKKMTGGFKEMLGKGGFGFVYKGKLRSGQAAAIKMLETSKANGQDFINEVATIGRIHHANIVRLIGFCSQGSRNALVYEFMSNGSLDTHIFNQERSITLGWQKLFEISLGIARGIEYLHRGCDIQILHFDIKPHNILLDENFAPKISDFGLAKFYEKMDSIASLTAARGTIGYMAPELFYKNIGRISYKADVYSFGMLLLEMAGKRKNIKVPTEGAPNDNLSQIYYPFWVYDKLVDGNLEIEDATDEETKIVRKMIITGLWCIQMQPSSRPSMSKAVEMLEGNLENLQFPPKPLLFPIKSIKYDEDKLASSSSTSAE